MDQLPTSPALARALSERNYSSLTPVQAAILEPAAAGRDLLVSARTGSGKTVAFGLAIADTLLQGAERLGQGGDPLALVIAPTRELALQVQRELEWLYEFAGARVVACVGGMDPRREARALNDGAHIVVGTPGRLRDHLERNALRLGSLRAIILDEADEMLDLGFRDDIEFILNDTPAERRTLMFSATLPKGIVTLAKSYQRDAHRIEAAAGEEGHADIEYRAVRISQRETEYVVVNLLRYVDAPCSIVFANTRDACRHLQATLQERGFSAVLLSGELSQGERNLALQALRDGRARVCVATDVAARGIDLPNLGLVIHAELPNDAEILQHRSGRTGRAGRKGISVMLVPPARRRKAERLIHEAGLNPVWGPPPMADEIRALDRKRLLDDPLLTEERSEEDVAMAKVLMEGRSAEDIAAAFASLYRQRLPTPEDVTDPANGRSERERPMRDRPERGPRDRDRPERSERPDRGPRDRDRPERAERGPRPERSDHGLGESGAWFRLELGRKQNADPKWLLPMLCRRGDISRNDIGAIRIFEGETKFEVRGEAVAAFIENIKLPDEEGFKIEPISGGPGASAGSERPKKNFRDRAPRDDSRGDRGHDRDRGPRADGDAPTAYRPREDRDAAPRRERTESSDRPREARAFKPREDRPYTPHEDRPGRASEARPSRDDRPRPARDRADGEGFSPRPKRFGSDEPRGAPRSEGFGPKGPRGMRTGGPSRGDAPRSEGAGFGGPRSDRGGDRAGGKPGGKFGKPGGRPGSFGPKSGPKAGPKSGPRKG